MLVFKRLLCLPARACLHLASRMARHGPQLLRFKPCCWCADDASAVLALADSAVSADASDSQVGRIACCVAVLISCYEKNNVLN
jgi:hypothetical protein